MSIRWCGHTAAAVSHWCWVPRPTTSSEWTLDEGRVLLGELLERATVPDNVYSHAWSVGDTVIWDNRGVLHRAAPYDPGSARELLRTTVLSDEPIQ
jgi:alpha-ketoglutarate-dependent taurine dioxygenase